MKKRLLILFTTLTLLFAFTGCSADGQAFWKENQKMQNWSAYSQKGTGSIAVDLAGEKVAMDFAVDSFYNTKEMNGFMKMHFTTSDAKVKVPDMEIYLDKGIAYINKGYFTGAYEMNNQKVPGKLADLKADYIGFHYGPPVTTGSAFTITSATGMPDMAALMKKMADPAQQEKLMKLIGDTFQEVQIPVEKDGQTYTIKMDSDQLITAGLQAIDALVKGMPALSEEFGMKLSKVDLDKMATSYETAKKELPAQIEQIKKMIQGSSFTMKTTFGDSKIDQNLDLSIAIQGMGSIFMKMNVVSTKEEPKTVAAPGTLKLLSMQEFLTMSAPEKPEMSPPVIPASDTSIIINKDNSTFATPSQSYLAAPIKILLQEDVPYYESALLLEALGHKGAVSKGITLQGAHYLSAENLKQLGYTVTDTNNTLVVAK